MPDPRQSGLQPECIDHVGQVPPRLLVQQPRAEYLGTAGAAVQTAQHGLEMRMHPRPRIPRLDCQRVAQAGIGRAVLSDQHRQQAKKADCLEIAIEPPQQPAVESRAESACDVRKRP
ncbi:hypothetical protein G6F65_020095 [Rhizopus arrhizus]|nr:hypothetical protein G6F65_020095 [Rhizopus arrhizus]